jgi:predicted PhzF superfamily epimerase YddE/YHI9
VLQSGSTDIPMRCEGTLCWIRFPALDLQRASPPRDLESLLPAMPGQCATSGKEDGYLIIELPADSLLSAMQSPGERLAQYTMRALIVTCVQHDDPAVDVHFRYFAPQYGSDEDTATGSAMRLLARYWQGRGLGDHLAAQQRSPEGGLLYSRMEGDYVWVGGQVVDE